MARGSPTGRRRRTSRIATSARRASRTRRRAFAPAAFVTMMPGQGAGAPARTPACATSRSVGDDGRRRRQREIDVSRPGKPADNALLGAFDARLRAQWLNAPWFLCPADARARIEGWRQHCNEARPLLPGGLAVAHAASDRLRAPERLPRRARPVHQGRAGGRSRLSRPGHGASMEAGVGEPDEADGFEALLSRHGPAEAAGAMGLLAVLGLAGRAPPRWSARPGRSRGRGQAGHLLHSRQIGVHRHRRLPADPCGRGRARPAGSRTCLRDAPTMPRSGSATSR